MFNGFTGVFSNKNFLSLWISQLLSQLTISFVNFILLLKLYEVTSSTLATSFLWISFALPALLIGPFATVYVDLTDKRRVLMTTNLGQALIICLYAFSYMKYFFTLYIAVLIYSILNQFYVPAELSTLPAVVKKRDLPFANGLFLLTQQASIVVGFGIAGIVVRFLGFQSTLFMSAFFLLVATLSVVFLPTFKKQSLTGGFSKVLKKYFKKVWEGYAFLISRRDVFLPLILLITFQIVLVILMVNIPALSEQILKLDPDLGGIGIVMPAGLGTFTGAYFVPKLLAGGMRKRKLIQLSLGGMTGAFLILGYLVPDSFLLQRILLSIILVMVIGFSYIATIIVSQTYVQEVTPKAMRARIFGNFWILSTAATLLPVIAAGYAIHILGVRNFLLFLGLLTFIGFVGVTQRRFFRLSISN